MAVEMNAKKTRRIRTGLLLGVFTRRCLLLEAEKDEPGVKYPGSRNIVLDVSKDCAASHAFPCVRTVAAGFSTGCGMQLPAYSGGTAWAFHPLRVAAGVPASRIASVRQDG